VLAGAQGNYGADQAAFLSSFPPTPIAPLTRRYGDHAVIA
jgi:hypothetical protein